MSTGTASSADSTNSSQPPNADSTKPSQSQSAESNNPSQAQSGGTTPGSQSRSRIDRCEGSLTSETGSYSCSSNMERSDHKKKGHKPQKFKIYPNVIMAMRYTERLDEYFPDWLWKTMGATYEPFDLNMPKALPVDRPVHVYVNDPPITNTGDILARLIARGMYATGYVPDIIYCTPALRCLQTAHAVKQVSGTKSLIRVEPGLFECFSNYPLGLPKFANSDQRARFGVDENYVPHTKLENLMACKFETNEDFNTRVRHSLIRISKLHEVSNKKRDQVILIVAHAHTVDIAAGTFIREMRLSSDSELALSPKKIPHGSLLIMERVEGRKGWLPNLYAVPPVNYRDVTTQFDVGFVLREGTEHAKHEEKSAATAK
ncbi:hypothetical protein V3C99_014206 [Haemonchus contortus]|uniref:Phosphoglycerate mutase family protein n=1 Tax=Haemonchus contortus TaxID=6289 RepID=A0A7I4YTP6_HAECO